MNTPANAANTSRTIRTKVTLGRCCRRSLAITDSSVQLQSDEAHRPGWIVATIERRERTGHEVYREQPAGANGEVPGDRKVADRTKRYLTDAISWALQVESQQFTVFNQLGATEERPLRMLHGRFRGDAIVIVAMNGLAPHASVAACLPPRRDLIGPNRAGREALLVHPGLKLLRILEIAPA